jgi:hypothetical protein
MLSFDLSILHVQILRTCAVLDGAEADWTLGEMTYVWHLQRDTPRTCWFRYIETGQQT